MNDQPQVGMTFMGAAAWSVTATFGLQVVALFALSIRPGAHLDLVSGVACQAAAFLATLFLVVRVHEPERSLSDVLALRRTNSALYLLGAGLGLALEVPFSAVAGAIEQRWPPSLDELAARAQALEAPTLGKKVAIVLAAAVVGPLVEEMFFRGAMYRGIRRKHGVSLTTLGVALFFAIAHVDIRHFLPIFLIGLVVTYARAASGSLVPGLIVHATFNATSVLGSFNEAADLSAASESLPKAWIAAGLVATSLLLAAYHVIAVRSATCAAARAQDLA